MSPSYDKPVVQSELQRVVAYVLNVEAMTESIGFILDKEMEEFTRELSGIENRLPGFTKRLRRQIDKEIKRTVSLKLPHLRREFEEIFGSRLTQDDIREALRFRRHQISRQLRDPSFVRSLDTDNHRGTKLSERMSAQMTPEQRAFVEGFIRSPCGVKLAPLTQHLETLKYDWVQTVAGDVSRRLPFMGSDILQKYYTPKRDRPS